MHVLISGAGIAGSCLAWFLARLDYKVTVLERSKSLLGQGQNIDLSSGAISILKKMGLLEEVRKFNTTEKGTIFLDRSGNELAKFPVNPKGPSPTAEFEILRGDLAMIFYNAVKDHPNVEFLFGTTIVDLVSNDDKSVKVKLSDEKVHEYDIAFAADGQWSKLRKLAFDDSTIKTVDRKAYCGYWTIPRQPQDTDWWYVFWGMKARVVSLRPDPHGTMRANVTMMPLDEETKQKWQKITRGEAKGKKDAIKEYFVDAGWQTQRFLDALDDAADFYLHNLEQIKMERWSAGRVVCVGDAAHAPTPITGMGTTLAVMGTYIVAGELSKLKPEEDPAIAFAAYDKIFHKHTEKVQDIPSFVPGIAHPASKWHLWALEAGAIVASKVLQLPLVSNFFGSREDEENDKNFRVPDYPSLDSKLVKAA